METRGLNASKLEPQWHALSIDETLIQLKSHPNGLNDAEVTKRLNHYGYNILPPAKSVSYLKIFLSQFKNALIYILLISALISLFVAEYTDASVILIVLLSNAFIGSIQEYNAAKNAANLNSLIKTQVRVKRNGELVHVDAANLVPGDIVILEAGNKVPADLRLIEAQQLRINEALLTGESSSVNKNCARVALNSLLGDRANLAFSASQVSSGRGVAIVVATGIHTQIGKIAKVMAHEVKLVAPLVVRMERFTQQLSIMVLTLCCVFMLLALWRGFSFQQVFFLSIALAVSAIPEGLPIAITVALSVASKRMAKRNVLIRKLAAVEGLGSCSIIASDKTGTLTVNQQTIKIVQFASGDILQIGGEGYNADGLIQTMDSTTPLSANQQALLTQVALAGAIANEGSLFHSPTGWQHNGDEVDVAFLALAYKAGITTDFKSQISELELTPYQSEHKYSGARCKFQQHQLSVVKGAVETILAQAKYQLAADGSLTKLDIAAIESKALNLTAQGYRVMAIAQQTSPQTDLVLLALIGMQDPLRAESINAVAACQKAGIRVCMVTGDHPSTALAIAKELGIAKDESDVISGGQLEILQTEQPQNWQNLIRHKSVFARVNPLQKMHIVTALHKLGHYIAVTGDGVNDVPALKKANISIAMGSGSDLTKDSADMILLNDDFSSIVAGVEEGRYAYDNIRKVTYMSVSSAIGEIFLLLMAVAIGVPLPLIAIQILWVNLICNGLQDVALAFEAGEIESMQQAPRAKNESVFNRLMIEESVIAGLALGGICLGFWLTALKLGMSEYHARSLLFVLLIFLENIHVFNCRSEHRSVLKSPIRNNYFVVLSVIGAQLIQLIISHIPFMQRVLHLDVINWREWLMLFALSLLLLLIMELYKFFKFSNSRVNPTHAK